MRNGIRIHWPNGPTGSCAYQVIVDGHVVDERQTNEEAWRAYDKHTGAAKSKAEDTSDWLFRKSIDT